MQDRLAKSTCNARPDHTCGSNSEVGARNRHVRFPPDSDQTADIAGGPFRAIDTLFYHLVGAAQ
jgi:hypothetical protein